jgi:hypothetical protein
MVVELWERQPCDTENSWRAFVAYRDMYAPRRLAIPGYPSSALHTWYKEHDWALRVAAYDAYMDAIVRTETEAIMKESVHDMTVAQKRILLDAREVVARELQKLSQQAREGVAPGNIKVGDLVKLADLTIKMERLLKDMPTDNVQVAWDPDKLSTEELRQLTALMQKAAPEDSSE